ncbi:MAG: serine/threonine-protein kinase, partial [Myxococcales bacterium]
METDVAQLKQGQVLGKDFRILRPLAAGGMGAVYLVEQLSTGRERALKIMHPQFVKSEDSRARFTQEAKVGARIRSDHVVEVVSAGVDDDTGIPWLAMELLDGEELAKRIQRKKFLPPSETLEIFRQLCHALGEAHKNGLVHRDLKPQNIFMARSRRQGEAFTVKILDFGVAKLVQEQQGEGDHTKPVGTPRWMAPEQSDQGAAIRPATDVWALGLIAFNCLTGKFYWRCANQEKANLTALLRELVIEPIEPASKRAAELGATGALPRGFDEWFSRCVERDQNRRYPDASAALEALVPVLSNAPAWKASVSDAVADDA